jgi:hypothetical protein
MIRRLVEDAALPPGSGLRIARHEEKSWLTMCLAAEAGPDDAVLVEHEATSSSHRLRGTGLPINSWTPGPARPARRSTYDPRQSPGCGTAREGAGGAARQPSTWHPGTPRLARNTQASKSQG